MYISIGYGLFSVQRAPAPPAVALLSPPAVALPGAARRRTPRRRPPSHSPAPDANAFDLYLVRLGRFVRMAH
jgi:hypothetical protein